jgi:hypothetical protein
MKLSKKSGASIAMIVAGLVIGGATLIGAANAETAKGRCFGVNGCKGQSACKSAHNNCKGHNDCKGKGWLSMLEQECTDQGGQFEQV